MPLTETEKAYLAGIVDGEGSIMVTRSNARASGNHYYVQLKIANTSEELLSWLREKCGGPDKKILMFSKHKRFLHYRTVYHIQFVSREALPILRDIYPYLIIKKAQAYLAIAFYEENAAGLEQYGKDGKYFGNGHPIPRYLCLFRRLIKRFMHDLNKGLVSKEIVDALK